MVENVCVRCKEPFQLTSNSQKYCKDCAFIVKLECKKLFVKRKRQQETGTLGPNPVRKKDGSINVRAERNAIQREMIKLGLRKKDD